MKSTRAAFQTFVLLLATCCFGRAQQAKPQATALHTMWKVEGKSSVMYLLGSIHVLSTNEYPLPHQMDAAFTNSATLVFETDLAAMEDPQLQMTLLSKCQLPAGETLAGQLSAPAYAQFSNHVQSAGLPVAMFDQFKPALAALTLATLEIQRLGLSPEHGLDKHYFELGRKAGKGVVPLETVDFQLSLITDFTRDEGELLMKTTLEEIDDTKTELQAMLQAWKTGDSVGLENLLNKAARQAPAIYKRLLTDRNARWVPKLEELLRGNKNAMVIVGAGHLVGPEGVVELLKKKGWKLKQL